MAETTRRRGATLIIPRLREELDAAQQHNSALQARIRHMAAALHRYGQHDSTCAVHVYWRTITCGNSQHIEIVPLEERKCTCGFDHALTYTTPGTPAIEYEHRGSSETMASRRLAGGAPTREEGSCA